MYWQLTQQDPVANAYTNPTLGTNVTVILAGCFAIIPSICVQLCFFVQFTAVIGIRHRKLWLVLRLFLTCLGFLGISFRLAITFGTGLYVFHDIPALPPDWVINVATIFYFTSIGFWCLIFCFRVLKSLAFRLRTGVPLRKYEALHIALLTSLESMIIPGMSDVHNFHLSRPTSLILSVVFFIVLQQLQPKGFPEADDFVNPSILILMPFGSLWATSFETNQNQRSHTAGGNHSNNAENRGPLIPLRRPRTGDGNMAFPGGWHRNEASTFQANEAESPTEDGQGLITVSRQFSVSTRPRTPNGNAVSGHV